MQNDEVFGLRSIYVSGGQTIYIFLTYSIALSATLVALYAGLLGLLTTDFFQSHAVYLHGIEMTWFKDLNTPEVFGFMKNQVTPFFIQYENTEPLYAWHILPLGQYQKTRAAAPKTEVRSHFQHHAVLGLSTPPKRPRGLARDSHHGVGGTVGSGYRVPNYRALSAGDPARIHDLTFDYRGFGRSPGVPSESGLIQDAIAVVEWAMKTAQIPPSRIAIFSQSLGTAVNIAVATHFAQQNPPIVFAGHILVAPFVDVATLASTYRIAGTIPLLSPFARFPVLFEALRAQIRDKWPTSERIVQYVQACEANGMPYRLELVHAEDDYDIPWYHTAALSSVAASAATGGNWSEKKDLESGGTVREWKTENGRIRQQIVKFGLHDVIMGNPVVSLAVMRTFDRAGALP